MDHNGLGNTATGNGRRKPTPSGNYAEKEKVESGNAALFYWLCSTHTPHHTTNEHLLVRESKRRGYFNYLQDEACKERKTIRRCFVASRTCLSGLVYNMTSVQHNFQMAGKLIFDRICSAYWAAAAETAALLQIIYTKKHWSEIESLLRTGKIEQHFFR